MKRILFLIILLLNLLPCFKQGKLTIATMQVNAQSYGNEGDMGDCGTEFDRVEGNCIVTYLIECFDFHKVETEIGRSCVGDGGTNDCAGELGGSAYTDQCGICVGGTTGLYECSQDCAGEWGGSAFIDACGICVGGNTGLLECSMDCNGEWGGTAYQDNCGTCVGGNTGLVECSPDCNGDPGGNAYYDQCGICVGGSTGIVMGCITDCNNEPGGTAVYDDCGYCVYGNTGNLPCDCNGDPGGSAYYNECGVCVGGGSSNADQCPYTNSTEEPKSYYFKIDGDDTKYYSSSTITLKEQTNNKVITLYDESGATVNGSQFTWKRYKKFFGSEVFMNPPGAETGDHISLVLNTQGNIKIKVSKTGMSDLVLHIAIYSGEALVFTQGSNYNGLFGFDNVGWQFPAISANYDNDFALNSIDYHVPWLSINKANSSNASALVSIKNSIVPSSLNYVDIKTEPANGNILFKRASSSGAATATLRLTRAELQTMIANDEKLAIESSAPLSAANPIDYFRANVVVKNSGGNKIGALNVSCQNPVEKKIIIVYVKTTAGGSYRDTELPEQIILDYLNKNSHNQFFRKWVLAQDGAGNSYPKFMDLSGTTLTDDAKQILNPLKAAYDDLFIAQGLPELNPDGVLEQNTKRVVFITDKLCGTSKGAGHFRGIYSMITILGKEPSIAHESGHTIGLRHIFSDGSNPDYYNIPQQTTQNFMDYSALPDLRNMFYFKQWKEIF